MGKLTIAPKNNGEKGGCFTSIDHGNIDKKDSHGRHRRHGPPVHVALLSQIPC